MKDSFPHFPILALTATADKITKADILEQLRLSGECFVDMICSHLGVERSSEPLESAEILPSFDAIELPIEESNSDKELSYMYKQKQLHANAYAPWSNEEEGTLRFLYRQGKTVKELAIILQRNEGSIRSKLRKLRLGVFYKLQNLL